MSISPATSSFICAAQRGKIDFAGRVRLEVLHLVAGHRRRGRVGAVRRVGDQDLLARIAARFQAGAHQQDAGELAVRAGGRLQGDGIHAGDLDELLGERLA